MGKSKGRPKKAPEDLKSQVIIIPFTPKQKRLIVEAGNSVSTVGHTAWARDILIAAAEAQLERQRQSLSGNSRE
jgi:hypothetical protein